MNAPVDVSFFPRAAKPLTSYRPYWARRFGTAPFLPMSRAEMDFNTRSPKTASRRGLPRPENAHPGKTGSGSLE
ncbi:hypothetical protein HMPREF0185_02809 [Brevundimonas diminuta 470-4]|nr:hypothetical protein HMPREF0185_02809 [Brevundimonas diminuta 470-4]